MTFPDGQVIDDDVRLADPIETPIHGRTGVGHVVDGPWAAALSAFTGRDIRLVRCDKPAGTRAGNPASIVSDGSIEALAQQLHAPVLDARRFRMLIELEGAQAHEEDTWIGRRIAIGTAVLAVTIPDARCAITTQDPDLGTRDLDTLRGIIAYRGLRDGKHADFGVLADVAQPGRVTLGDTVTVLRRRLGPGAVTSTKCAGSVRASTATSSSQRTVGRRCATERPAPRPAANGGATPRHAQDVEPAYGTSRRR